MSPFEKLVAILAVALSILYLFTCSSFLSETTKKSINHDQLVVYILTEVDYELAYGDKNTDIEALVDKALYKALTEK